MIQLVQLAREPQYHLPVSASTGLTSACHHVCHRTSFFVVVIVVCFVFASRVLGLYLQPLRLTRQTLCELRSLPSHWFSCFAGEKLKHGEVKS